MSALTATDPTLFFSRHDENDPRLGDRVKTKPQVSGVVVLGYPDDEGVRLNGGQPGAAEGPRSIRHWLYRMTPHLERTLKPFSDVGDLNLEGDLAARHERATRVVSEFLQQGHQVLTLGGGNDYAYPDGHAFLNATAGQAKPLVINVDAHFDVRGLERGFSSGTPFYRLLESNHEFDFFEFGIQPHCNSRAHLEYVRSQGGHVLTMEEHFTSGVSLLELTQRKWGELFLKKRPAFLAIDMDAFAWPYAQGTSAAWPLGISPQEFWPVLHFWLTRLDVRVMGLYEVAPRMDSTGTPKLAAQWAHMYLHV